MHRAPLLSRSAALAVPVFQARAGTRALPAPAPRADAAPAERATPHGGTSLIDVPVHSKPADPARGAGLPARLRTGLEGLSGLAMDDVRVHRDSPEPARLGALAYARGSDIHLGPGQERHLPHEAWHVVQQKQGRVAATAQMKGMGLNDDAGLEAEADRMGSRLAAWNTPNVAASSGLRESRAPSNSALQRQTPATRMQAPAQTGVAWTSGDFVAHYYAGGGRAVNLTAIGLADTFRNHPSVQQAVNEFVATAVARPDVGGTMNDPTVTDVTDTIFSVGHSTFFRTASFGPKFCGFSFSIRDWFRDPASLGMELGGTPYPINHQWSEAHPKLTQGK